MKALAELLSPKPDPELYGKYVKKTADLINRPYVVVFRMVEKWDPAQEIKEINEIKDTHIVNTLFTPRYDPITCNLKVNPHLKGGPP